MIPAPFDYEVAESVDHAIELLGSGPDAKLLAGGHSLLPLMRLRLARPELLVDIGRLSDLSYVREDGDVIAIGALTRYRDLEQDELLRSECAIVADAAGTIASTPAVINAVVDALSPFGVTDVTMPAKPENVWRALQEGGAK